VCSGGGDFTFDPQFSTAMLDYSFAKHRNLTELGVCRTPRLPAVRQPGAVMPRPGTGAFRFMERISLRLRHFF
jgi:hypothetical protein